MTPFTLCLPSNVTNNLYQSDTWSGFTINLGFDLSPENIFPAISNAKMQFRSADRRLIYELNSDTPSINGVPENHPDQTIGCITILDPINWIISIDSQILPMIAGDYMWDLEVVDILNVKRTLLVGTINICSDITQ